MNWLRRWWRQLKAKTLVLSSEEWGGTLHDYANGRWDLLQTWQGENWEEIGDLLQNMWDSGKDAIYVATIKVGAKDGYFVVTDSNRAYAARYFFRDIYSAKEAYQDTVEYCRKVADKMGFRRPENTEGVQS